MTKNLFSVPIFFIVFRETLEAAIIVSVLLGLAEQIVDEDPSRIAGVAPPSSSDIESDTKGGTSSDHAGSSSPAPFEDEKVQARRLVRKLRIQV